MFLRLRMRQVECLLKAIKAVVSLVFVYVVHVVHVADTTSYRACGSAACTVLMG